MRNPYKFFSDQKKIHQKIEIAFNFIWEFPLKFIQTKKKIIPEIRSQKHPLGSSSWEPFLKKSYQEGVFDFFYPDPQLVQIFKPTRNFPGQLLYIYISIYEYSV